MFAVERRERIALNESRFREINDRVKRELGGLRHQPDRLGLVCECGRVDCREQLHLTVAEYERVREDPMLFAIVSGHEFPDAEDVVERGERFAIVRKHEDVRHIASGTHPRPPGPPQP